MDWWGKSSQSYDALLSWREEHLCHSFFLIQFLVLFWQVLANFRQFFTYFLNNYRRSQISLANILRGRRSSGPFSRNNHIQVILGDLFAKKIGEIRKLDGNRRQRSSFKNAIEELFQAKCEVQSFFLWMFDLQQKYFDKILLGERLVRW